MAWLLLFCLGTFVALHRYAAFRLRADFWIAGCGILATPGWAIVVFAPEWVGWLVTVLILGATAMGLYGLVLASTVEAKAIRAIKDVLPMWRVYLGLPGVYAASVRIPDRRGGYTVDKKRAMAGLLICSIGCICTCIYYWPTRPVYTIYLCIWLVLWIYPFSLRRRVS